MKLRNKKTGEIVEREEFILIKHIEGDGGWQDGSYHSLAELNEEWEDYKPAEPLIKDEKIRKLVLAWAKLTQTTEILIVKRRPLRGAKFTEFFSQGKNISLELLGRFDELADIKEYTITELCGEEE